MNRRRCGRCARFAVFYLSEAELPGLAPYVCAKHLAREVAAVLEERGIAVVDVECAPYGSESVAALARRADTA